MAREFSPAHICSTDTRTTGQSRTPFYRIPVQCVLPPHISDSILTNGNAAQRQRVVRSRGLDDSFAKARIGFHESLQNRRQIQRERRSALQRIPLFETLLNFQKQRTIYTANETQRIPGTVVREEGAPQTGDLAVDEAYEYMGNTVDFFWDVFQRNSIDDAGLALSGTVHYSKEYDNAFWDGQRMIYGDGDNVQFQRFTKAIDVIGHELTHGVTQYEAGLVYWKQAGAINESLSDVFGSLVKQYVNNQRADQADWLIGEGLFTNNVSGVAIRSMKAPGTAYDDPVLGKDPQPAHMRDYVNTIQDSGGVHINSGIPNHAFYLAAIYMGGYAWEKAGLIWYETLRSPLLRRGAQFRAFAQLTLQIAQQLFSTASPESKAIQQAWGEVGIMIS